MLILLLEPILLNGIPRTKRISKTHSRTIHLIDGRVVSQEIADMFDRQILDIRVDAFNNVVMVYSESHESGTGRSVTGTGKLEAFIMFILRLYWFSCW
jgi:hypothetical protein